MKPQTSSGDVAGFILEQAVSGLAASTGMLLVLDDEGTHLALVESLGYPEGAAAPSARIPLDAPLPATAAVRHEELVLVETPEELRDRFPGVTTRLAHGAALACVPLLAEGTTVGLLQLSFARPRRFGEPDVTFLHAIGHLGALALTRDRSGALDTRARQRMSFLARASHALSESLDPEVTLRNIAELAISEIADWCAVDVPDPIEGRRTVIVAHEDPAKVAAAEEVGRQYPPGHDEDSPTSTVLRTGRSEYVPDVTPQRLAQIARDEKHQRLLEGLGHRSAMIVPACARGRTLAAITLVSSHRLFDLDDLELAEELGRRVGLALDNAQLHEDARTSRARLAGILASAMDAIITIDSEQHIVLFNEAAERMFGYDALEVVGETVDALIPERFRAAHAGHVRRFGETGVTNRAMGSLGTIWGRRSDGTEFPIEATISKLDDRGQRLYTVILRDVTDRVAKERELEAAARHKDQFLAMLGHELRNPLAAIRHAHDLHRSSDAATGSELAHEVIERQLHHVTRLIDDLLDVSRIARGKIDLRIEPIDLRAAVESVLSDHQTRARRADIRLVSDLPEGAAWVDGDAARLVQVLENLIDNSVKFTDAGGEVRISLRTDGEEHVVEVRDTGIGLEADVQDHLFEPFRQADASLARTRGGLGLGLAVSRGIVELHGGSIEAQSEGPRRGSTFTVRLPARQKAGKPRPESAAPRTLPFRRILLVEDNEDAALLLGKLLERAGAEPLLAHSGEEGLAIARREQPELVLCDIGLPGALDGYRVAEALRADAGLASVPLVALSGYGLPEDVARARAAGFDAHLTKPVSFQQLHATLCDVAERRRPPA